MKKNLAVDFESLFGWQTLNEKRLLTRITGAIIIMIGAIIISILSKTTE
ncbi:MAG: hypothetical protein ABH986_04565 [archaeon]